MTNYIAPKAATDIDTPHRIMGRTSGEIEEIIIDQEWGAIRRMQEISAGTTMELYNLYDAQQPQVVIRLEDNSSTLQDPLITVVGAGTLSVDGDIEPGEYMEYKGGSTVTVYDENWNVLRTQPATATNFTVGNGNTSIATAAGSGSGTPTIKVQYITLGDVYILESNKNL